jgi:hypothetical protein
MGAFPKQGAQDEGVIKSCHAFWESPPFMGFTSYKTQREGYHEPKLG